MNWVFCCGFEFKDSFSQTSLVLTTRGHCVPFNELKSRVYRVSKEVSASPSKPCHGDLDIGVTAVHQAPCPVPGPSICNPVSSRNSPLRFFSNEERGSSGQLTLRPAHLGCVRPRLLPPHFLQAEHPTDANLTAEAHLCAEHSHE